MDILIKNMKMPKGDIPLVLIIASDGTVEEIDDSDEINETEAKAIAIPPHGRSIDADALSRRLVKWEEEALFDKDIVRASAYRNVRDILNKSAVVLEASE